jgi:hypothetical protein
MEVVYELPDDWQDQGAQCPGGGIYISSSEVTFFLRLSSQVLRRQQEVPYFHRTLRSDQALHKEIFRYILCRKSFECSKTS